MVKLIFSIIIAAGAAFFVVDRGPALISDIRAQVTDLLPGGDPYALGKEEGAKLKSDQSYIDQIDISLIPGAQELVQKIKSGEVSEALLGDLANIYWPVAALKSGIIDISAENREKFRLGVIDGYFNKTY
jgi:hypothetical protein